MTERSQFQPDNTDSTHSQIAEGKRLRLCIIQPVMKGYRLPFFQGLAHKLSVQGIDLQVVYGRPWAIEAKRGDNVELPAPLGLSVNSRMLGGKLLWMPVLRPLLQADAIVVEHANKHVLNYPLAFAHFLGLKRVAYWGHGRDRQSDPNTLGEKFKQCSLHWADWWFAYTRGASEYVASRGFPLDRITTVGNAIDTRELAEQIDSISAEEKKTMLLELGLNPNGKRLIYCGSLYTNKRLDLMMEGIDLLHQRMPQVQLIVLGGGPMAGDIETYAEKRQWVRYVGPQFGRQKALYLAASHIWLNPGLVGLGILDAFSAGLPLVTTDVPIHSPEIEYLEHGVNGLMVAPSALGLADALYDLLSDPALLQSLSSGARNSAKAYSIESMVERYAKGVVNWLKSS